MPQITPVAKSSPTADTKKKRRTPFPKDPVIETKQLSPGNNSTWYTARIDSMRSYEVNVIDSPLWYEAEPDSALKNTVESFNDDEGRKVVSSSFITFKGYKAVDYTVQQGTITLRNRSLIIDHSLYTLTASFDNVIVDEQGFNKFVDSFEQI